MNKYQIARVVLFSFLLAGFSLPVFAASLTLQNPLTVNNFGDLILRISEFIRNIIGGLAVLVILWAGFLFVTSAGSPEQLGRAKKALTYAIIGAGIALAAEGLIMVVRSVIGAG